MRKKVGIVDSGIGGLTLLKNSIDQGIDTDFFYICDTHNVPYGDKSQGFMLEKMRQMSLKLIQKKVDGIFIACNTATAQTIEKLREEFKEVPFIGIEPYINYLNHSQIVETNQVALILTQATFKSKRFQRLKEIHDPKNIIDIYPLKNLALIIETLKNPEINISQIEDQILKELDFLSRPNINYKYLILGCTHYPIIKSLIEEKYKLQCIDPSKHVINHLKEKLQLTESTTHTGLFYSNFDNSNFWSENDIHNYTFLP